MVNHDPTYCLQITLKLPKNLLVSGHLPWITGLLCPKIGPEFPTLWAADASGQLTIWYVPREGLEFTPAYTVKAHYSAINDLQKTWRHVISIGDDGLVVLHDIIGFYRVRTVDVMYYCLYYNLFQSTPHIAAYKNNPYHGQIPRRIKCLHVKENYETGGTLLLGTSYGEVMIISLGTTV
ncbi:hypothetical protein EON65_06755 [archaeon]|nr:MAG: hypothetical protein EON65_06755 [archaeon]